MSETVEKHSAYGMAQFSHVSGRARMFGSEFEHHNYVMLTIKRAEHHRSLSRSWFFGREELIRVRMSEAQYVELISRPNMGSGIPITLEWVAGEKMADIPEVKTERQRNESEFIATCQRVASKMDEAVRELESAIKLGKFTKTVMGRVLGIFTSAQQDIAKNMPFVEQSYAEAVESTITRAKIEVEAYIANAVTLAGLKALEAPAVKLIEATKDEEARDAG